MKILLTGAHFTPAQAVIEELKKLPLHERLEIVYVGRKYTLEGSKVLSVESQVLPKISVKFLTINTGRLRRSLDLKTLTSLLKIPVGFVQSFYYLIKEDPDVVVSFGGYVGVPTVVVSWLLSKPILIHEQTLVSGLANLISSFFATRIAVSYDKDYPFAKDKTVLTGNPIRKDVISPKKSFINRDLDLIFEKARKEKLPVVLVTGGNQGSHIINSTVAKSLEKLLSKAIVIHQTGDSDFRDYESLSSEKKNLKKGDRYQVLKWIDAQDLGLIYKNIDLAVCRCGANTLNELAFFGVPSIMIPLPNLYKNEQEVNARYYHDLGLGDVILQDKLTSKVLVETVEKILKEKKEFIKRAAMAKGLVIKDSAKRISQEILLLSLQK